MGEVLDSTPPVVTVSAAADSDVAAATDRRIEAIREQTAVLRERLAVLSREPTRERATLP
jgi:hypothetical protein